VVRVSFFIHDLAANPVVRAEPLMRALEKAGHEVEPIGFLISGPEVFGPYRNKRIFKTIRSGIGVDEIIGRSRGLASLATGETIYACKPLMTSFLPALLASGFGRKKPLLLDVEDNDVWGAPTSETLKGFVNCYLRGFKSATACKWGILLHPLTRLCNHVTVSSRKLQRIYGGTILRHGPSAEVFNPQLPKLDPFIWKAHYGLRQDALCIGFAGTPQHHKGFDRMVTVLKSCTYPYQLLLTGPKDHPHFQQAKQLFGKRCILTGYLENSEMPGFLAATDLVPVFQKPSPYTEAQLPAKLLEAMAMGKLIVGSNVGDLPEILTPPNSQRRGWTVDFSDHEGLIKLLDKIPTMSCEQKGLIQQNARTWFLNHASVEANATVLDNIFSGAKR
jgi:glycosyltransferase involved in cell wall biosynthesis